MLNDIASRLDFAALLDQRGRMLQMHSALPDLALIPERLVFRDAVDRPFEMDLQALSTSRHFELKTLVGQEVTVQLLQADGSHAPWHGYVVEAAQLGADGGLARYRLLIRPWLSLLALRTDSFAFQDKTAVEIIEDVFADYPQANWEMQTSEPLRKRSLCIQYNETDLDFVRRLLADEGLGFSFRHLVGDAAQQAQQAQRARHQLVVTDRRVDAARRAQLGALRFTSQHPTAQLPGQADAVTAFESARTVQGNAVTLGSWNYKTLAGTTANARSALDIGALPTLEQYDGAGAYRFESAGHAQRAAELALAALELDYKRCQGQGSVRRMAAGAVFALVDHPLFGANSSAFNYAGAVTASRQRPDNQFTLTAVEHHASNNLGSQAAQLLASTDLEKGTYKNHFHAVPAAAVLVPHRRALPTAPGLQMAVVVGVAGEPLGTERDLRVKIQFPWQRGTAALAGGLRHDSNSPDTTGNAPQSDRSLSWVRVAWPSAGANWGSAFVPRIGTEVAVEFVEGDIDRPVIVGQLYNAQDQPPFAAGVDSGVNHAGSIAGLHSTHLGGGGFNQWAIDDAAGQLRQRLLTSYGQAHLSIGHLIQQEGGSAQRGAWRGSGTELATAGWASVRAGKGLLISSTQRAATHGSAQSTQMDAKEAVAQLKAARELGAKLGSAAGTATALRLHSHDDGQALAKLIEAIDPAQKGRHGAPVNGQEVMKPGADGRAAGADPVEAFAEPVIVLDTPASAVLATPAALMSFSGQDTSLTANSDLHQAAAHTWASVSGHTASLFSHQGGIKLHAANGAVSVRAHNDEMQIWADQDVTIVSVNDEIRIQAQSKIQLIGGSSKLELDGANISFECPGQFAVKSATHAFLGGGGRQAELPALPVGTVDAAVVTHWVSAQYLDPQTGEAIEGAEYDIHFEGGGKVGGKLNANGEGRHENVANKAVTKIIYKPRQPDPDKPHPPLTDLLG